jgi:ring-1,2-phenylacetyl-CoA epoxidase subunit PaaE
MSIHFHKLRIKEIRKETSDCVSISFEIPPELKAAFAFQHGQNITIKKEINGQETRRSYSICSSPGEHELRIAVKKVESGLFSTLANTSLKAGDELEILPPTGKFNTPLNPANRKRYLAFAAGSGITPVISIIKTTLGTEPGSPFTLVYGNRTRASIIFFEELEGLKNKYMSRFNLVYVLSRERTETPIHYGRIGIDKLVELSVMLDYTSFDEIFICGPEGMIFSLKEYLEQKGIDRKKIHFELFTTPGQQAGINRPFATSEISSEKSQVTIKLDGRSFDFELGYNEEPILDGALKQGADLPYACKGGVCCTCKARLLEGRVDMDVHWGLEDEEVEQGYILTCQSHPLSSRVVVDFDVK